MMVKHKQTYFRYFGYGDQDVILCEHCGAVAVDIHHGVFKSHGGGNDIANLIALCRSCHDKAHQSRQFNNYLKQLIKKRDEY